MTRTAVRPDAVNVQILRAIDAESRMHPWDCARFVPSRWSAWICRLFDLYLGIRWKPKPHGAKRTKSSSHSDPLVFFFTRADRPQYDPVR